MSALGTIPAVSSDISGDLISLDIDLANVELGSELLVCRGLKSIGNPFVFEV